MNAPADRRYTPEHEWARADGGRVRVGLTDYAQDALGDVVFVQLPAVGTEFGKGDGFGEVESTKSVSDVYSPISGTVVTVNERLDAEPSLVNTDPYGEGWLCEITVADPAELEALMDADAYRAHVEG